MNSGIFYALVTYIMWGILPIYWKQFHHISSTQLIGHRILWSFIVLILMIIFTRQWGKFRKKMDAPTLKVHGISALLLSVNWLTYVWAINAGFIVETSLGYFINPLFSVLLGMIFLKEKLRAMQWIPLGLAILGVLYLTFVYGRLPWIALLLASTFGIYGLLKKKSALGSLYGLTLETGIMLLPALGYLIYEISRGQGIFLKINPATDFLLIGAGVATSVPLLLFALAAQRIPLTMIGLMQYIAPTIQFLIGILIYKEPFTSSQFVGFGIIWLALIIFGVESWVEHRAHPLPISAD
ncbi:MAG: EamA family transporter RarD [Anaerolineae bacterium]|jgi:chloramphenicol-sensitive protein RarD|nr:EamA family transporter RarD [Anaerolineae bacterium]MBT3711824.1 EamA family transporter RarD [Anaerolineae bacterium]MBT4312328.1 EamA family transporter RarD [Anaerolineae bacterium]MBT4457358.1 EamA family transporter RarD [Anaerolineae bacterium]MBT4842901.1 EamA family transporter RarD [Anaerolineae bacterium]